MGRLPQNIAPFTAEGAPRWRPSQEERAFVNQKRAQRASWPAIARMLGRSEPDVRRALDVAYPMDAPPPLTAVERAPSPVKDKAQPTYIARSRSTTTIRFRALLALSKNESLTSEQLRERLWPSGRKSIVVTLSGMIADGEIVMQPRSVYRITAKGRSAVSQPEGLKVTALQRVGRGGRG
jgi:hypothetical protein